MRGLLARGDHGAAPAGGVVGEQGPEHRVSVSERHRRRGVLLLRAVLHVNGEVPAGLWGREAGRASPRAQSA